MPMLLLFVAKHRLILFHMAKSFIWLNETKQRVNEFKTEYTINPNYNTNKAFIKQVNKCMNITFGPIILTHIISKLGKNKTKY